MSALPSWWETALKVLVACVVGAAIGWEREVADRLSLIHISEPTRPY